MHYFYILSTTTSAQLSVRHNFWRRRVSLHQVKACGVYERRLHLPALCRCTGASSMWLERRCISPGSVLVSWVCFPAQTGLRRDGTLSPHYVTLPFWLLYFCWSSYTMFEMCLWTSRVCLISYCSLLVSVVKQWVNATWKGQSKYCKYLIYTCFLCCIVLG